MTNETASLLRENTGTTGIMTTLRTAVEILAHYDIPHIVVGGIAVQEHGYHRVTLDVDLVVPDILEALEYLTADLSGPFERIPHCEDRVRDRRNQVFVDLLPAGHVLKDGCKVPFPIPEKVSEFPVLANLPEIISLKLDSWSGSPVRRLKDKVDVIELIKVRDLPRDLPVRSQITKLYEETWDALQADR